MIFPKERNFIFYLVNALILFYECNGSFLANTLEYFKQEKIKNSGLHDSLSFNQVWEVDEPLLKFHASFNGALTGITNIDVKEAFVTPDLKIRIEATLEDSTLSGTYGLNGTYYKLVPLNGNGNVMIHLKNFKIYLDTQIKAMNGTIQLLYYDIDYGFDIFDVSISGLTGLNDVGEVIQYFVKDLLPNLLTKRRAQIISKVKNFVMTKGNEMLCGFTPETAIEIIKALFF